MSTRIGRMDPSCSALEESGFLHFGELKILLHPGGFILGDRFMWPAGQQQPRHVGPACPGTFPLAQLGPLLPQLTVMMTLMLEGGGDQGEF